MTAPRYQPPWPPQPPTKKKLTLGRKLLFATLGIVLFCCTGTTAIGIFADDPDNPATENAGNAAAETTRPAVRGLAETAGTTEPSAEPEESTPSPSPSTTTRSATPKPRKTTSPPRPKPKPTKTTPRPRQTTTAPAGRTVTPGAFCSPEGATGRSKKGKLYRCMKKAGDERARWRPM